MNQKTTTAVKQFTSNLFFILLFLMLSFSGWSQTTIYQQNFDGNNGTYTNTLVSQSGTNGWIASSTAAQYSNYRHVWNFSNVTTGGNANVLPISGRSLGMGFWNGNAPNVANQFFRTWDGTNCSILAPTTRWAHVGVSTVGYQNITVEFKWRCVGEVDSGTVYDYGTINTSINGGTNWLMDETGGQGGTTSANGSFTGGLYFGNAGVQTTTLTLPSSRDNQANFRLAFRMVIDECYGTGGGFIIDDIIIRGTPITLCSGTPTGGTTVLTPSTGTFGSTFNASVTGSTSGTGLTYQWESAPTATGPWTNVTGATLATATLTAPSSIVTTFYRRKITCSGLSSYSTAVSHTTTCSPSHINGNCAAPGDCAYIGISKVNLGTINYTTGFANTTPAYNNYYATQSTNASEGSSQTLSVTYSDTGSPVNLGKVGAWIDWNNDGDFDDINEFLGVTSGVTNNQIVTFTVTVPSGTAVGDKRLRIRSAFNSETLTSTDACTIKEYGETEDYKLTIQASNRTLTVSNAYTGASYANGVNTFANNASVTTTSGTRTGYTVTGWTGTGSVPATGATGSSTFNITQNSTISWNWSCNAAITNVTNGTGCGDITLTAVGAAGTTTYNWYNTITGGSLIHTSSTGTWIVSGLTSATTYYVAANNGTCESPRIAITATPTPTSAQIIFSQGESLCAAGNASISAETNDDNIYTVKWYDVANGGTALHTGFTYTPTVTQTTTFYAAAVDGSCESARTDVTVTLNAKTWNGSQSTAWNENTNWTPVGIPTEEHCVIIPQVTNSPIIANGIEASAKSLTLAENSSLLVQSGGSITVVENVILAETAGETVANLTLENNAYLKQTQNVSTNNNVGKITVHRNSTPMFRLEATGWSSPVEDQKLSDFAIGTLPNRIYKYDEPSNSFVTTGINAATTFEDGRGYSIRSPNTYPSYTVVNTPTPITFNGVFYGKPNNGDVSINITSSNLGFNYVGNPYPSPINAYTLLGDNQTIDALYFWTHEAPPINGAYAANNYASFNEMGGTVAAAGGEEPDGIIQVGQGFVARTASPTLLQFTNSLRETSSNGQFFRHGEKHRMWLNLSNGQTNFNQILIGYSTNATMGIDHQIDAKMFSYSGSSIYSLIDTEKFVIQGRSIPFDTNDVVPVGFKATETGIYTIAIDHVDGLFSENQTIYLNDLFLNTTHNLSEGAYNFLADAGTSNNRFEVVYRDNALSIDNPELNNNNWIVYKNDNQIHIKSNGFNIKNVEIYDLTGRLLISKKDINSETFNYPANFAQQVLLVKINNTLVKKVL